MSYKRILIVLMGAIGDVTRGLPLAVRIKRSWPEARITWAVEPLSAPLVTGHPAIDRVVVFDRKRGLAGYRRLIAELRSEPYDLVLDMQRHFKSGMTSLLSGGKVRLGFHRRNAKELNWLFNNRRIDYAEHFSSKLLHYQKFGDALSLPPLKPLEFGLGAKAGTRERIGSLLEEELSLHGYPADARLAGMIIGSSWPSRLWFADAYRTLIRDLFERHRLISVLIGSKGEAAFASEIARSLEVPIVDLCGKTSLDELPALFERLTLTVGSDSGPMHIAAACNRRVISLWGSTSPLRSAPYGSEELVLQSPIGCSPCFRRECPGLNRLCMSDIPHEAVLARVEGLLLGGVG